MSCEPRTDRQAYGFRPAFARSGAELRLALHVVWIFFDNGTPRGLARFLIGHTVEEARANGWEELTNGALIEPAEQAGFVLMVTTDKNIRNSIILKAAAGPDCAGSCLVADGVGKEYSKRSAMRLRDDINQDGVEIACIARSWDSNLPWAVMAADRKGGAMGRALPEKYCRNIS